MDTIRAHGFFAMKATDFSKQLERDSQSRVLCTVNNLKLRAEWIKSLSSAFDMIPRQAWHDLYADWLFGLLPQMGADKLPADA